MSNNRRHFLKLLGYSGLASSLPISKNFAFNLDNSNEGFVLHEEEQESFWIEGKRDPVYFMIGKSKGVNKSSLCRAVVGVKGGIPPHKHLNEDEIIYFQNGTGLFTLSESNMKSRLEVLLSFRKGYGMH